MLLLLSLLLLLFPTHLFAANNKRSYQVFRITPNATRQLDFLTNLWSNAAQRGLDFWQPPTKVRKEVHVMVDPESEHEFLGILRKENIGHEVLIGDVEKLIQQREHPEPGSGPAGRVQYDDAGGIPFGFNRYHSYNEMIQYGSQLQMRYPDIVNTFSIGRTHEGRPLQIFKIGARSTGYNTEPKPAIWVDAGIHAREWVAPSSAMYFIHELATAYNSDPEIRRLVDGVDWYIMPVVNPDGYEYSRSTTDPKVRLWRKNRSPQVCKQRRRTFFGFRQECCQGVDLNRNFDFHFGEEGSSSDPCEEIYRGTTAFSEPESRAIRDFIQRPGYNFQAFITMHSYSQIWMYPYGHRRRSYPTDVAELKTVAIRARAALRAMFGTDYQVGTGADTLYPASGGSDDWAKDGAGIKFVYLLELRPEEKVWDGFILDQRQILPTAKETFEGIKIVADTILRRAGVHTVNGNSIVEPTSIVNPLVVGGRGSVGSIRTRGPSSIGGGNGGGGGQVVAGSFISTGISSRISPSTTIGRRKDTCQDNNSQCPWWAAFGGCRAWKDMDTICPKSCRTCDLHGRNRDVNNCLDERTDCQSWKNLNLCSWVQQTCKQTCGGC